MLRDPTAAFAARKGRLTGVEVRVPDGPDGRIPTALILGGRGTGQDAARLGSNIRHVVVAALSYPFAGDPTVKGVRAVLELPRILLATDYLLEQPYIDANRFELIGVSLGAFLVSPAGVLDKRIRRVWIVQGGGNPAGVIEYGLRDRVGIRPLRKVIAMLLNVVAAGHYLARTLGRPDFAPPSNRDQRQE